MSIAEIAPLLAETAGALLPYLEDPDVMEIMANPDGRLFIERFGYGMERVADLENVCFVPEGTYWTRRR